MELTGCTGITEQSEQYDLYISYWQPHIHTSCCYRADSHRSLGRGSTVSQHRSWPAPRYYTMYRNNTIRINKLTVNTSLYACYQRTYTKLLVVS